MENSTMTDYGRHAMLQRIVLVLLTVAVFGISLWNGFVWDDYLYLVGKAVYRDFNLRDIFFSLANGIEYQPLRDVTCALDYLVWGENPSGFHGTNLLFFLGNVLLVHYLAALIIRRCCALTGRTPSWSAPFLVAVVFAIHPINAETVNFIGCRNVLVAGLGFFLAIILVIRFLEKADKPPYSIYGAALVAFTCALLSKAFPIMLPLLLSSMLPLLFPGQLKRLALLLVPFYAVSFGFFVLFKKIADKVGFTNANEMLEATSTLAGKVALALQIPAFYLGRIFYPQGFSVEYVIDFATRLQSTRALVGGAVLVLLLVVAVQSRRRFPEITIGIFWFCAALVPFLNFFSTHPIVADRYAYFPLFGIVLVVAATVDRISPDRLKLLLLVPPVLVLAVLSVSRSREWHSNETLWQANIRNYPGNSKSYLNLAAYYFKDGQQQKALELLAANSSIPNLALYLDFFQGKYFLEQNELEKARVMFQKVLDADGNFVGALRCMAFIAEKEGDFIAAARYYNTALSPDKEDHFLERPFILQRLAEIKRLWLDKHLAAMKLRLAQNPNDRNARRELAITLDRLGFYQEALEQYHAFEKSGLTEWQLSQNIANCYFNLNMASEAVRYYEQTVSLGGNSETTLNNLGVAYRKLKLNEKSVKVLQQAVEMFPAAPYPRFNLGVTYFAAGRMKDARLTLEDVDRQFPQLRRRTEPYLHKLKVQAD